MSNEIELPYNYPEKKDEKVASKEWIRKAIEMFDENFDKDGKPITGRGYILHRRHSQPVGFSIRKLRRVQQKSNRK